MAASREGCRRFLIKVNSVFPFFNWPLTSSLINSSKITIIFAVGVMIDYPIANIVIVMWFKRRSVRYIWAADFVRRLLSNLAGSQTLRGAWSIFTAVFVKLYCRI